MTDAVTQNWSRTYTYRAGRIHCPGTVDEVRGIVAASPHVRALGTRHSFNDLGDSPGELVHLGGLEPDITVDSEAMTVSVSGAARYGDVAAYLQRHGFALHNTGSLPHISVIGACATGTHGSGDANGTLPTAVSAVEIVTADGDLVTFVRGDDRFEGIPVSLGALGVATRVELDIQPTYDVRQDSYVNLPWDVLYERFDEITASAYSVSLFTRWRDGIDQVLLKSRIGTEPFAAPRAFYGAMPQPPEQWRTLISDDPNLTERGGVAGPWSERLPHFRLDATPSNGDEIQSEYFVDRRHAREACEAMASLADLFEPVLMIGELRTLAADSLWLSPAYGRDTLALHFTWRNDPDALAAVLPELERALAPYDPRPHWGKVFAMPGEQVTSPYPRIDDFRALVRRFDPHGKFRNAFLDRVVFGDRAG